MANQDDWAKSFPPLRQLPASDFARLRDGSMIVVLPAGSRIFGPGHAPENFLLLVDGTIRVQQVSEGGREIVLYRVSAGESCALTTACLMGYEEYLAEGIAETAVKAVAIPRALFDELIASSREFRRFVFTAFSRRVTDLFRIIEEVAFARIDVRLAQLLSAVRNHTEDGDASLEYGRAPFGALLFFRLLGSERLIVDFGVGVVGAGMQMLFAADLEQLDAVVSTDLFSEVVEEFEYREGLFWGPIGRDFEVDGEWQAVPGLGLFGNHVLAPRR